MNLSPSVLRAPFYPADPLTSLTQRTSLDDVSAIVIRHLLAATQAEAIRDIEAMADNKKGAKYESMYRFIDSEITKKAPCYEPICDEPERAIEHESYMFMGQFLQALSQLPDETIQALSEIFEKAFKEIPLKEFRDLPKKAQFHKRLIEKGQYFAENLKDNIMDCSRTACEVAFEDHEWDIFAAIAIDAEIQNFEKFLNSLSLNLKKGSREAEDVFRNLLTLTRKMTKNYHTDSYKKAVEEWGARPH